MSYLPPYHTPYYPHYSTPYHSSLFSTSTLGHSSALDTALSAAATTPTAGAAGRRYSLDSGAVLQNYRRAREEEELNLRRYLSDLECNGIQNRRNDAEHRVKELEAAIEAAKKQLETLKHSHDEAKDELQKADKEWSKAQEEREKAYGSPSKGGHSSSGHGSSGHKDDKGKHPVGKHDNPFIPNALERRMESATGHDF
jgi:peptidoglycan hydrolase CwlO-like protein